MAKRDEGRDLREGRHGSESSNSNASWRSQATIKDGRDTSQGQGGMDGSRLLMRTKKSRYALSFATAEKKLEFGGKGLEINFIPPESGTNWH
jgi:hypothetical protein